MKSRLLAVTAVISINVVLSTSVNAALVGRLAATPGGTDYQAYYDDQLDITWAADPNINGSNTWDNQMSWVANLTIGGVGGWRLPNMDVNGDGNIVLECSSVSQAVCADNEYAHMTAYGAGSILGSGITSWNSSIFGSISYFGYWSRTESFTNSTDAWVFVLSGTPVGISTALVKNDVSNAWAVLSGDVSAVPVPASIWLFGSGLIGLIGLAKRKKV